VIPAVIALWFRLTIIESPRYTADVGRDTRKAASELDQYLLLQAQTAGVSAFSMNTNPENQNQEIYPLRRMSSGADTGADSGAASNDGSAPLDTEASPYDIGRSSPPLEEHHFEGNNFEKGRQITTDQLHSGTASDDGHFPRTESPVQYMTTNAGPPPEEHPIDAPQLETAEEIKTPPAPSWKEFKQYFWHDGNLRTLMATSFCWFCKFSSSLYIKLVQN